jgi:eukaryotic-like serine/threonine-protein kinase
MIGHRLSHYRIEEQIGAGGMGVVYRAYDEHLQRDVAVKILKPGTLADEAAQKRFRNEALSLARLNHPNIATVHEFGNQDGINFLVTEYIVGITLDAKLAAGPMPGAEVIRLGAQLAAGLAAAHQQGIVHRDLKPGNLRLTSDGRLKILDFGLAQPMPRASELGATATITEPMQDVGTLPYMSPEQLRGEVLDARTDIWAAGAALYEMATGRKPFLQNTPAMLINAILNQSPDPPSKTVPMVPDVLSAVILKALARDPGQRYQSAAELAADLDRLAAPTAALGPQLPMSRRSMWMAFAVAGALLLLIGSFLYLRHSTPPNSSPSGSRRRSVAVLGFKNLSENPEKAWLSTALSEMLTTELGEGDELRAVSGESVAQMKASLALPDADSFSRQTLTRIRQNLGSDEVVLGSYVPLGDGVLRLDVRLQDTLAGETLFTVSEKGSEKEIDELVGRAGAELRARLGVRALSDAQSALVRASLPSTPEAARLYARGLQQLRLFDAQSARDLLEKSATLDPEHAPTHSTLAEAWSVLGYESKAKDEAKRALALSTKISREERLLIEGRAHELLSEMPEAIESYHALWKFFPDTVDYGLFLVRAQVNGAKPNDAEITLAELRKLTVSEADRARIDLADASIASALSDFKRKQERAAVSAELGRSIGANLIVAQAAQLEGDAWERMGQSRKAIDLSHQAKEFYILAGDRRGAARALLSIGVVFFDQGDYEGAKKKFEEALPVFQQIGAKRGIRATLELIGNVFYAEGNLREARKYYEEVLPYDREINDPSGLASDYGNLANALDGMGDLQGALKMQQDALMIFNKIGDRRGASATANNLGNLYVEMGNLDDARKYFDQSLAIKREIAFRRGEPYPMTGLGDVLLARGKLPEARKQYEEALGLCTEMNNDDLAAQLRLSLALIALFEKRYEDGETLARQAAVGYEKTNSAGNGAWAESVLARNLVGSGRLAEAQAAVTRAAALLKLTSMQAPPYEVALANSRIKAKSGKTGVALQELQTALKSTRKFGYRVYEYEIRLAIAEIEKGAGSVSADSDLAVLEREARAQGILLVANQAQALLSQHQVKAK